MYVCMYDVCVGLVSEVVWALGSRSKGHGFEPHQGHHSQMDIVQSSSSASYHPHQSTQL